jgi:hypothetical protein
VIAAARKTLTKRRETMMLMTEIQIGGLHKRLLSDARHLFNIGELSVDERTELIRRYEALYGKDTLKISPSAIPDQPIPDVQQPPQTEGLSNSAFVLYQYKLEKEVLSLVDEIRQDARLKEYGNR